MNKKIILTESQYSRLLEFIDEAGKKAPKITAKQEPQTKGVVEPNMGSEFSNPRFKEIKDKLLIQKPNTAIIFDLVDGTKIKMCVGEVNGSNFLLKVTGVKGDVKKEYYIDNTVEMDVNSLEMIKDDENGSQYKLNIKYYKVKKTFKNDELIFNSIIIGESCVIEKKGEKINKPEETGETEPILTDQSEKLKSDARIAHDLILNNRDLKLAFYKAPSLMNLFMAELNGKKAPGTGIIPTLQLVGGYIDKRNVEVLEAKFIPNESIEYRFLHSKNNIWIKGIILVNDISDAHLYKARIKNENNNIIKIKRKSNIKKDSFICDIFSENKEPRRNQVIVINPKTSSGYESINIEH